MPTATQEKDISLTNVKVTHKKHQVHVPSTVQADTLFTFTNQLDWIIDPLQRKMLSPRYCIENIKYLKISSLKEIAIPMRCFCDINMHRLGDHLNWYGYYGLAFSKEWGMEKGIQPVRYINPESRLRKDFTTAFNATLIETKKKCASHKKLQNYILHDMMYCKPYSGRFKNRRTGKSQPKCYTDECEWRFIPDVTVAGYDSVIYDSNILHPSNINTISDSMDGVAEISLTFDYTDIKYIIVETMDDLNRITSVILKFDTTEEIKHSLISKILVWENSKGDF